MTPEAEAKIAEIRSGYEFLLALSVAIAKLDLVKWRQDLERAEALGPIIDPTYFRSYLASNKPQIIKDLIDAAIPLKAALLKHQDAIAAMREEENRARVH